MEIVGGQVWIENHPREGWAPGRVDSVTATGAFLVVDEQGEQFEVARDQARRVDEACTRGVNDLLSLGDFNEGALLHNVRVRYFRDEIYTGIGDPILISVNPFKKIPGLYSEDRQRLYREHVSGVAREAPPHLFAVGAASHAAMLADGKNQSIIITGESGAGKTEATKRILTYFANLQRSSSQVQAGSMSIEDQVLRSNPILEAFGNAKTVRNDNSSRFGKFIDIDFDHGGRLQSAKVSNYLLEKTRIVQQQPNERGYHAFYQLCAGAASIGLQSVLGLGSPRDHIYTRGCVEIPGVSDASDFTEMVECMSSLGMTVEERDSVFQVAAAVLHLGDVEFEEHPKIQDGCKLVDDGKLELICSMIKVEPAALAKVFQFKTFQDPFTKKIIERPQDMHGASYTRHTMAKVAYSRLFDWLVWRINKSTAAKEGGEFRDSTKIGLLDIYGFEVFEWNSFEQLCINFANEKLQQHFNAHMFTLEQQLYTDEGISWSHIKWQDNREIIEALEKRPLGVFCIIDSECLMPNATDETCLHKIYNACKNSRIVFKPTKFATTDFAVAHYAGQVIYDVISFLEKNTDKLHGDITSILRSSHLPLLSTLFSDPHFAPERAAASEGGDVGSTRAVTPRRALTPRRSMAGSTSAQRTVTPVRIRDKAMHVTVSMMFRQQLDQLVDDLNRTNPRYVRCIKPNPRKRELDFDSLDIQRQLRCAGMLESIRIRRAGYSVRRPFRDFFHRFRVLAPRMTVSGGMEPDYKDLCHRLLVEVEETYRREGAAVEEKSWAIGRSKVFLKEELQTLLEKSMASRLTGSIVRIQCLWRGHRHRKRFATMRAAALTLQTVLRAFTYRADFQKIFQAQIQRRREHQQRVDAIRQEADDLRAKNTSLKAELSALRQERAELLAAASAAEGAEQKSAELEQLRAAYEELQLRHGALTSRLLRYSAVLAERSAGRP